MKIEAKIFHDYMYTAFDFGMSKFCYDFELGDNGKFEFGKLSKRMYKIHKEEIENESR